MIAASPDAHERWFAAIAGLLLSVLFVLVLQLTGGSAKAIAVFPVLALLLILAGSFELTLSALVVCLYVDVHMANYSSAVLLSPLVAVSFLLHRRDIAWREFAHPLSMPILVYGLCIVPSFLNATQPARSLIGLGNVAAFLIVLYASYAAIRTRADIRRIAAVYLAVTCANGLIVIVESILGEHRPFGVAGIMYVDYAGLGVCVAIAMIAVSRGTMRKVLLLPAGVIGTALILTQTRNSWISAILTLGVLGGYLLIRPDIAGVARKRIAGAVTTGVLAAGVVWVIATSVNPAVKERAATLTGQGSDLGDATAPAVNSLVSRYFIWDTALNAFLAHPYVGIGVYAFPYSSQHYSTLPRQWYAQYVKGNSPHQTHFAVLSETGIVGMAGYCVFLIAALRFAFRAIGTAAGPGGRRYALVAATGLTYCCISMMFTDAWLWGQGIVLLGLVMGLMLVNAKIGESGSGRGPAEGLP